MASFYGSAQGNDAFRTTFQGNRADSFHSTIHEGFIIAHSGAFSSSKDEYGNHPQTISSRPSRARSSSAKRLRTRSSNARRSRLDLASGNHSNNRRTS
jgi:hypothetical protein